MVSSQVNFFSRCPPCYFWIRVIKFVSGCDQHPVLRGPVTSPTCLQKGLAKMAEMTDKIEEESTFYKWLKSAFLDKHYRRLSGNGTTEICHLEDVKEDDAESLGLTKFKYRRLARLYADFKAQSEQCSHGKSATSKAAFKTSSSSIVLTLPEVMKDFVETRDGQGHVIVRTESLKCQFKNLYYKSPVTPTQVFSNSFTLQMEGERMKYSSSLHDCELWCRKERSKRTNLLLGTAKSPMIDSWTPYYQNQSSYGILKIARSWYQKKMGFNQEKVNMHTCASFLKDAKMPWQIKMRRIVNKKFKRP